jgi:tRNA threonylcarbamoyladenosine modification (KEOPS) complex Cgi121 subunit
MECWVNELYPGEVLRVGLFSKPTNLKSLCERMAAGELSNCVMIDPKMIAGDLHLKAAHVRAVFDEFEGKMRSTSLPTELILSLTASRQIRDALKHFGISEGSDEIVVAMLRGNDAEFLKIAEEVDGAELLPLSLLSEGTLRDTDRLRKYFRISDEQLTVSSLEDAVVSLTALRS